MTQELQDALFAKYPSIFQQRTLSPKDTCMCWGIECPDGWYGLIDNMCEELTKLEKEWDVKVICQQIKEKFGTLRFYHYVKDGDRWSVVQKDENDKGVSCFDGKCETDRRFDCGSEWFEKSTPQKEVESRLNWITSRYESLSGDICCDCGTYATFGNPIICTQGWVSYICKRCHDANTKAHEEAKNYLTTYEIPNSSETASTMKEGINE